MEHAKQLEGEAPTSRRRFIAGYDWNRRWVAGGSTESRPPFIRRAARQGNVSSFGQFIVGDCLIRDRLVKDERRRGKTADAGKFCYC